MYLVFLVKEKVDFPCIGTGIVLYFFRLPMQRQLSLKGKFLKKEGAQMGWKTPFLMIKKGNFFGVQAISAPIFRR